jgi:hypothetical protein
MCDELSMREIRQCDMLFASDLPDDVMHLFRDAGEEHGGRPADLPRPTTMTSFSRQSRDSIAVAA